MGRMEIDVANQFSLHKASSGCPRLHYSAIKCRSHRNRGHRVGVGLSQHGIRLDKVSEGQSGGRQAGMSSQSEPITLSRAKYTHGQNKERQLQQLIREVGSSYVGIYINCATI